MALNLIPEIGARYSYLGIADFEVNRILYDVDLSENRMFVPSTLVINGVPTPVLFIDEGYQSESQLQRFILVDQSKTIIELLKDCVVVIAIIAYA